jgi:hypothetical protein
MARKYVNPNRGQTPEPLRTVIARTTWKFPMPDVLERLGLPRDLNPDYVNYFGGQLHVSFKEDRGPLPAERADALIGWLREEAELQKEGQNGTQDQ